MSATATRTRTRTTTTGPRNKDVKAKGTFKNGGEFTDKPLQDADLKDGLTPEGPVVEETKWTKRYAEPKDKIAMFREELATKIGTLDSDEEWQEYLSFMVRMRNRRYSMNNLFLIALQRPDATHVAGYAEWKKRGRQVRKGEKGISIMGPVFGNEPVLDGAGRPMLDAKGKPRTEQRIVGVTPKAVFDISQTDGPPIPSDHQVITEEPPVGLIEDLEQAIADQGFTVEYEEMTGSRHGYTTTDGSKRVVIKKGMTEGSRARTLAHELGHVAAGHTTRADEYHTGHGGERGSMEVEADSISYTILRANGMSPEIGKANAAYVSSWGGKTPEALKAAADSVAKSVRAVFEKSSWRNAIL